MIKRFLILAVLLFLAVAGIAADQELTGRATMVHDGDTFILLKDDQTWCTVRMWGIDAPELAQEGGIDARNALAALIDGKRVKVITSGLDNRGKRVVGKIFVGRKLQVYVNLVMLQRGHAWYYKTYAPKDIDLAVAESIARTNAIGLWDSDDPPVAPWDYRHSKK